MPLLPLVMTLPLAAAPRRSNPAPLRPPAPPPLLAGGMRLLVIAIEFSRDRFSGNGVYGASQVRALVALGHEVMVISGRPAAAAQARPSREGAARLVEVPLPAWGCLDAGCSWHEFAAGAGGDEAVAEAAAFAAEAVLGVDWHSAPAFEALAAGLRRASAPVPPFVFANYRIYLRTAEDGHRDLIYRLEQRALELSVLATVLSRSDAEYLSRHLARPGGPPLPPVRVLLPALRSDMDRLPPPPDAASHGAAAPLPQRRRYLACCVRLAPDKGADRFVDLALELQRRGALARLGATPLMCGAGWGTPFGQQCRDRMAAGVPQTRLVDSFLGPAELAEVYSQTILNIHPAVYDAFGWVLRLGTWAGGRKARLGCVAPSLMPVHSCPLAHLPSHLHGTA